MRPDASEGAVIQGDEAIEAASQAALSFPLSRLRSLLISPGTAAELAQQEASFGTIVFDENGVSGGMRLHLMQPIRTALADWRDARARFETALAPKHSELNAVRDAEQALEKLQGEEYEALAKIEQKLRQKGDYDRVRRAKDDAERRWIDFKNRHAGREPKMFAYTWAYKIAILMIGVVELFINYDTLLQFIGVPVIAGGSAVILAVLLAFAAHGHGEMLKQWGYSFSESRPPDVRARNWRYFGLSTAAFLLVIVAAGAARYSAAMQVLSVTLHQGSGLNLDVGTVDVNPIRDVVISMLANVAAWVVGIFISYNAHDDDPEYMDAKRQYNSAHRAFLVITASREKEKTHVIAEYAEKIKDKRVEAQTRASAVQSELNMQKMVKAHGLAVGEEIEQVIKSNIETYRDAITRAALANAGNVNLVLKGSASPITPFDVKSMPLPSGEALQQLLAA